MFREVCEAYNWASPTEIGKLTYYQLRMLTCDKAELGGIQSMSIEDARARGLID